MSFLGVFIVAVVVMILLVTLKIVEEAKGRQILLSTIREKADRLVVYGVVCAERGLRSFFSAFSRIVILGSLRKVAMALIAFMHALEGSIISLMDILRRKSRSSSK